MPQSYTPEFKKKIVRLHEEEGRTYKSITAEYGVSKASISKWCSEFSKECQSSPEAKEDYDNMKEMLRLKRENEEPVSYTHLRAHETGRNLVCRLLLEKKKKKKPNIL